MVRQLFARGLLAFLLAFSAVRAASGDLVSPFLLNPANGHRYALLASDTWANSEAEAVSMNGHLATIRNQAEQDWVFQTFGNYGGIKRLLWIGLNDIANEATFVWASGAPVSYTNWAPNEPNGGNSEDFVAMYYPGHSAAGRWNDWGSRSADPIGIPFNGVVELIPQTLGTLIATGALWRYWDLGPNGLDPNWRSKAFNDSTWRAGPAQLGYGDGDEATVVGYGGNMSDRYITTCFRREFTVPNASLFSKLVLRVLRDDGVLVFLNGTEVFRSNMPTNNPITFNTLASTTATNGDETTNFFSAAINPSFLLNGTNVLAAEIHQATNNSSDISFDLELIGITELNPLALRIVPGASQITLRWQDLPAGYVLETTQLLGDSSTWNTVTNAVLDTNGNNQVSLPKSIGPAFFRLVHH